LDLVAAAKRLREETIPKFVEDILAGYCRVENTEQLKREMHARGINLRFLGKVRSFIDKEKNSKLDEIVCSEMFARTEKQTIRVLMRSIKSKELSSEDVKPVISYFNLLFGNTSGKNIFSFFGNASNHDINSICHALDTRYQTFNLQKIWH